MTIENWETSDGTPFRTLKADMGLVFRNKITLEVYGECLDISNIDSPDNYEEIDNPTVE